MKNILKKIIGMGMSGVIALSTVFVVASIPTTVSAHGERSQEPFLRMRTVQWYDVTWSKATVAVNEQVVVKGKFRIAPDWPASAAKPDVAFLNISTPGPVFVRKKTLINGVSATNSMGLKLGQDYEWEVHLKARHPGRWHIHSMLNVKDAGPIVGPGKYIEVTGDYADFKNEVTTLTGETVDLEHYGIKQAVMWHSLWAVIGVAWLLYWLAKPIFFARYPVAMSEDGDSLITPTDKKVTAGFLVVALGLTFYGYMKAEADYPITLPLQAAMANVDPLPQSEEQVKIKTETATYRVPGRAMKATITITNNTGQAIKLGEFNTATVRFINPNVGIMDETAKGYPDYLLAQEGLTVENDRSIGPGETTTLSFIAQDAAWETERISSLIYDPDSHFGGLLFFYGADGTRYISNIHGSLIPKFI